MARPGFNMTLPFGRMHLHQVWQTGHAKTSTCTISILVWCHSPSHQLHLLHSLTLAACHPTSADHEVIASVTGPSVSAGTVTAVINVNGTTPTSTAPFVPPNHMSSIWWSIDHQRPQGIPLLVLFSKIWSLLLELHPLVQTNCSRNFVFIPIKEEWILWFLVLLVVFFLGFDPLAVSLRSTTQNMPSAALHPAVIDQYLFTELQKGHVAGPYAISPIPNLHVSFFGVTPKKYQHGKW